MNSKSQKKFDISKFKASELPDSYSLIKSPKELVIIHMNCRSMINKHKELENVIRETDADLVVNVMSCYFRSCGGPFTVVNKGRK